MTKKRIYYTIAFVLVLGVSAIAVLAIGNTYDLINQTSVTVTGGAVFQYYDTEYADGTGNLEPYLRVQASPNEAGYNANFKNPFNPQFDEKTGTWTHAIKLSEIPSIECAPPINSECVPGENYREFIADFNEANSGVNAQISIDAFEIYLFDADDVSFDPTVIANYPYERDGYYHPSIPPSDPTWGAPVWYLDGHILATEENSSGSGQGDMQILVPETLFDGYEECYYGSLTCNVYLVNFIAMGFFDEEFETSPPVVDDWETDATFEEIAVREYPVLDVSKTLEITYEDLIDWTLEKDVTPGLKVGSPGDVLDFDYIVSWTKTESMVNFRADGEIVFSNASGVDLQVQDYDDVFNGGEVVITDCPALPFVVADGASVTCSYTSDLYDPPTMPIGGWLNEVEVEYQEWDDGVLLGPVLNRFAEADHDENYTSRGTAAGSEPDIVTIQDVNDYVDINYDWSLPGITSADTEPYTNDYMCPTVSSLYVNGFYTYDVNNTAEIVETDDEDSETVTIECYVDPLVPTKDAAGTYDRTVEWTLDKTVDDDYHSGNAGELAGSSIWSVVATKSETLDNYKVAGKIWIYNPAAIAQTFTVGDELDDGTVATVTCPSATVAAGATMECTYEAFPADDSAVLNTVTVSAPGNPDQTATADVGWTENLIGFDTGTLSDDRFGYSELISASKTKNFPEDFWCSSEQADYTDGHYQYTETNTAVLNDNINLSASASVTVDCYLDPLEPSKDAAGEWDRTVEWTLEKTVDDDYHSGFAGELAGSSIWTVVATKTDSGPENYKVAGKIWIYNPAGIAQTFTVGDELDDGTIATVTCPSATVVAGATMECTYEAFPADDSATLNTVTVSALGNPDQTATADVGWTENLTGYDEGTLSDDRFGFSELISASRTETFPEDFVCPRDTSLYTDGFYSYTEINEAVLNDNINLSDSASVTVDCYLYASKWGKKWHDMNEDGDMDAGEPMLSGWTIELWDITDLGFETFVISTTTNENGRYDFVDILPWRSYAVCEVMEPGFVQTYPKVDTPAPLEEEIYLDCQSLGDDLGSIGFKLPNVIPGFEYGSGNFFGNKECLGCTLTQGYWKTHSEYGPAPYDDTWAKLPNGADTPFFGSGYSWYEIFQLAPKGGNAYIILAHQYMAATLSSMKDDDPASLASVAAEMAQAEALLMDYDQTLNSLLVPYIPEGDDRALAISIAETLDMFNNGDLPGGPPHCDY
jgi:hypothetical protein